MNEFVVDSLPEGPATNHYVHKSGSILFQPGQAISAADKAVLAEAGIEVLTGLDLTDNLQDFIHKCKNNRQSVDSLVVGEKISYSVYDRNGTLLLEAGATISDGLPTTFKSRGFEHIFIKKSAEELEFDKVKRFKELRSSGNAAVQPAAQKSGALTGKPVEELKAAEAKVDDKRLITNTGMVTASFLDKSVVEELSISDDPVSAHMRMVDKEAFRSSEDKNEFLNLRRESSAKMTQIFFGFKEGKSVQGDVVAEVANSLIGAMLYDQDMSLNLARDSAVTPKEWLAKHSFNVAILSMNIGAGMGYSQDQILELCYGAFMHNAGMYKVSEKILMQPRALTATERLEVQRHSIYGINALQKVVGLPISTPYVAYQIHERENGSGYPKGRRGSFLHPFAKIVAVADAYEALVEDRPHRKAVTPYVAMEAVVRAGSRGCFDRAVVKSLLNYMSLFPIGSWVELDGDRLAKVTSANGSSYTRPVVSVIFENRNRLEEPYRIDMKERRDVKIVKAFDGQSLEKNIMEGF